MYLLQKENKKLRDTVMRLEGENDNLANDFIASKISLRQEMDHVSKTTYFHII